MVQNPTALYQVKLAKIHVRDILYGVVVPGYVVQALHLCSHLGDFQGRPAEVKIYYLNMQIYQLTKIEFYKTEEDWLVFISTSAFV